jgi:ABC-type molybdate transport system substrate-binding protein
MATTTANADYVRVFAAGATKLAVGALSTAFEQATGHTQHDFEARSLTQEQD